MMKKIFKFKPLFSILCAVLFLVGIHGVAQAAPDGQCYPVNTTTNVGYKYVCTPSLPPTSKEISKCPIRITSINADDCNSNPAGYSIRPSTAGLEGGCVFSGSQYVCSPRPATLPSGCKGITATNISCDSVPDKYGCDNFGTNSCAPISATTAAPDTSANTPRNNQPNQTSVTPTQPTVSLSCKSTSSASFGSGHVQCELPVNQTPPSNCVRLYAGGVMGIGGSAGPYVDCLGVPTGYGCSTLNGVTTCDPIPPNVQTPKNLPAEKLTYYPLEPFIGVDESGGASFGNLIAFIFKLLFSVGGLIATVSLVIGGVSYMVSEVVDKKSAAKERISAALWGLFLLIISWLILNTINPQLLKFGNLFGDPKQVTTPVGAPTTVSTAGASANHINYPPNSQQAQNFTRLQGIQLLPQGPGVLYILNSQSLSTEDTSMRAAFTSACEKNAGGKIRTSSGGSDTGSIAYACIP